VVSTIRTWVTLAVVKYFVKDGISGFTCQSIVDGYTIGCKPYGTQWRTVHFISCKNKPSCHVDGKMETLNLLLYPDNARVIKTNSQQLRKFVHWQVFGWTADAVPHLSLKYARSIYIEVLWVFYAVTIIVWRDGKVESEILNRSCGRVDTVVYRMVRVSRGKELVHITILYQL